MSAMMRGKEEKILDVSASMQGALRFDDPVNLRINGKFEGTLDTKGKLMVGTNADIRANVTGEVIFVEGSVAGNVEAKEALKLSATARLTGDVKTPRLIVEDGAILVGRVEMPGLAGGGSVSGDVMTAYQVAKYLEVDVKKVGDWASSGVLPASMDKGEWLFEKEKVDEWISQGKVKL